ncbi:MAG: folate-binding protein YgfZ [Dehalococcoidia bacterium]|nr:folate-binding protein YgfZ [Dehalococcoidia bacterium]
MTTTAAPQSFTSRLLTEIVTFDMTHFGRLTVSGSDAIDLLNRLSTNDLEQLQPGQGISSVLTTNKGRIIDLLHVLHRGDDLLILTSTGTQTRVVEWIDFYTFIEDVSVEDITGKTSERLYIGEGAAELLSEQGILPTPLTDDLSHMQTEDGESQTTVIRADIGELPAYRIIAPSESPLPDFGLSTLDEDEFRSLRIEQAIASYPAEMNEDRNPLEANLKPHISFNKGCYIGQEVVARLNTYDRVQRFMCRLEFDDGTAAEPGSQIIVDGNTVGEVTSSVPSMALAFLRKRFYQDGATVEVESNGATLSAIVRDVRPPEDDD